MVRHGFRWYVAAVVVLLGTTSPLRAQRQRQSNASDAPHLAKAELVSLSFPGGTIHDYVEALRKVAPTVNVMLASPEVGESPVSPVELTDVSFRSAVQLLAGNVPLGERRFGRIDVSEIRQRTSDSRPVFRVSISIMRSQLNPTKVRVWSVTDILSAGTSDEAILTSIETAVGLLGSNREPAQIRFHKETGLILASGDDDQRDAINRVVKGLWVSVPERVDGSNGSDEKEAVKALLSEFGALRKQVQEQAQSIEALQKRLDEHHD